jgi:hypothetical protein
VSCATLVPASPDLPLHAPLADDAPAPVPRFDRITFACVLAALLGLLVLRLSALTYVDPDLWHEMSLARETLELGRLPLEDRFAYTPTVYPSVHHEWGTGMVLYAVYSVLGLPGIMLLKYLLIAALAGVCWMAARVRGASRAAIVSLAPLAIILGSIGFTTIRAQVFTLVFLAILLWCLELDRRGHRRWIWFWLPLYVVWLNLHAGFVVGAGLLAFHTIEQLLRGQKVLHLIGVGAAMALLVAVNPYGLEYYPYLWHALRLHRPLITEWAPLWQTDAAFVGMYLFSLVPVAYAAWQLGWRKMFGCLVLLVTAYAAWKHTRHLSLYAVAWVCYVPAWISATPLGDTLLDVWQRRRTWVRTCCIALAVLCFAQSLPAKPWQIQVPENLDHAPLAYPVGAIEYLKQNHFQGNLMVPFESGGFVMWNLHPQAKISIDGRYEVTYQPGVFEENVDFYAARPGWEDILSKYPTDAVLLPRSGPLARPMSAITDWKRIYRDEEFEVYEKYPNQEPGMAATRSSLGLRH